MLYFIDIKSIGPLTKEFIFNNVKEGFKFLAKGQYVYRKKEIIAFTNTLNKEQQKEIYRLAFEKNIDLKND